MSFLGEIKRRKVFQVAAVYLVASWLIMQVIDVIAEPLLLPDWLPRVVIVLLSVGFPIAIILSWAYDLTASGVERTGPLTPDEPDSPETIAAKTGLAVNLTVVGALAVLLVLVGLYVFWRDEPATTAGVSNFPAQSITSIDSTPGVLPNSVAVLLCDNLSPDPDDAYFAAGIHDEILNQLFKLGNLTPISRNAVLQYGNNPPPIPTVAEELRVESVMECSVRYAGDSVLVTAQLIDPDTNLHLWSDTYEGDLSDVSTLFAIQADIAMNIANALEAEFSPEEQEQMGEEPTSSAAAFALYLKAKDILAQGGDFSGPQALALEALDQAISLDPEFAGAYGLKASVLVNRGRLDPVLQPDRASVARDAARQALDYDENLASAHATLAALDALSGNWSEAERAYQRAYELNPNDTNVLAAYATFRRDVGQYEESARLYERSAELDPTIPRSQLGISYRYARNFDMAAAAFGQAIEVDPSTPEHRMHAAINEVLRGNQDEAREHLVVAEELWGNTMPSYRAVNFALSYFYIDEPTEAERFLNDIQTDLEAGASVEWEEDLIVLLEIARGDYARAQERLEAYLESYSGGSFLLGQIKANDYSDPVLEEPQWQALRDRIHPL